MTTPMLTCTELIISRLIANWTTTPIVYDNIDFEPHGTNSIALANNISASSIDNSFNSTTAQFGGFSAGKFMQVSGFTNASNNGYFNILTATATKITTSSILVTEAISPSKVISINDLNNPFIYCGVDIVDTQLMSLGSPGQTGALYRIFGNIDINILTPVNEGVGLGLQYADTISSIYRGQTFSDVLCLTPVVKPGGKQKYQTGNWWSTAVACPFKYNFIL